MKKVGLADWGGQAMKGGARFGCGVLQHGLQRGELPGQRIGGVRVHKPPNIGWLSLLGAEVGRPVVRLGRL